METTEYNDARDLMAMEALYQIVASILLSKHILLSREQFCRTTYTAVTTCDGLLAIVKRGLPLNLLMAEPAHSNGCARRG